MRSVDETAVFPAIRPEETAVAAEPEWKYAAALPVVRRSVHREHSGRRAHELLLAAGGVCVMVLLVLSLLGQARLAAMNDEAVALRRQAELLEQDRRLQMTESVPLSYAGTAGDTVEMTEDRVTVLHVGVGTRMGAGIRSFLDSFESYSP